MVESYATVSNPQTERSATWSYPNSETVLRTTDGVGIYATERGAGDTAIVVAHCFGGGHHQGSHAKVLGWLSKNFRVIAIDQRGQGKSEGECTLSHLEVYDIDAAVGWARELGAQTVVTLGFSMGSASVLRHAAISRVQPELPQYDHSIELKNPVDGVISIGGVAQWWYRGTWKMQILHVGVLYGFGRDLIRRWFGVRFGEDTWPAEDHPQRAAIQPIDPADAVRLLAPTPLLVIHGEFDDFFPTDHGQRLAASAQSPAEHRADFWLEKGMGHAEAATSMQLVERMSQWVRANAEMRR
jgi:pimeloyl-ACP methyl ester carboxylesterase